MSAYKRPKLTTQQVGSAGEHFVAAEIHRRGGYAVTFSGNMHDIDLLASDANHDRVISIQVKTKTSGTWQTSTTRGNRRRAPEAETKYWVFVDLGKEQPGFYIVPKWWIENDIFKAHNKYLKEFGGTAPRTTPVPITPSPRLVSRSGTTDGKCWASCRRVISRHSGVHHWHGQLRRPAVLSPTSS